MWINKDLFLYSEKDERYYIEGEIDLKLKEDKYLIKFEDKKGYFTISLNINMLKEMI